jgi:hypothetical protein
VYILLVMKMNQYLVIADDVFLYVKAKNQREAEITAKLNLNAKPTDMSVIRIKKGDWQLGRFIGMLRDQGFCHVDDEAKLRRKITDMKGIKPSKIDEALALASTFKSYSLRVHILESLLVNLRKNKPLNELFIGILREMDELDNGTPE